MAIHNQNVGVAILAAALAGSLAGFLLYNSAPDSEGTLGGLMRLGEADELERLWLALAEEVRDPALLVVDACAAEPLALNETVEPWIDRVNAAVGHPPNDAGGETRT